MTKSMSRPSELSADDLWRLLGCYATTVGYAEGVLFTDNRYVIEAAAQWCEEMGDNFLNEDTIVK